MNIHNKFVSIAFQNIDYRQAQLEEERERKIRELKESLERQKLEKEENKLRRIQLAESCAFFEGRNLFFNFL